MNSRLTNPILELNWAGWKSDTITLQRHGWEISVEQDVYSHTLRIAVRHQEAQVHGLSHPVEMNYLAMMEQVPVTLPSVNMRLVHKLHLNIMENQFNFEAIDAQPRIFEGERGTLDDFKIFQPIQAQEIITAPEDVNQLMQRILELQSPKQQELREKYRREERKAQRRVHAQVISLVAA